MEQRQEAGQGSAQREERGILSLALLEMAAPGGSGPSPGAAAHRGPRLQDHICLLLKAVWSQRSPARGWAVGSPSAEP